MLYNLNQFNAFGFVDSLRFFSTRQMASNDDRCVGMCRQEAVVRNKAKQQVFTHNQVQEPDG